MQLKHSLLGISRLTHLSHTRRIAFYRPAHALASHIHKSAFDRFFAVLIANHARIAGRESYEELPKAESAGTSKLVRIVGMSPQTLTIKRSVMPSAIYSAGANEIPRSTSPACAVRSVVKCPQPLELLGARLVAFRRSVTVTSLFGSAPWSPFVLMVEVIV